MKVSEVSERLNRIANIFAPDETEAFVNTWIPTATYVLKKAIALGYDTEQLMLVYVPAVSEYTFEGLLEKLHQTRKKKGCEWDNEWRWGSLWSETKEVFGDYGLGDEAQLFVMLRGEGKDGLFFTSTYIFEQIAKAKEFFTEKEGTTYLSPVAYISAQIVLASESEDGTKGLLDYNDGEYTFTMFPQFSDDGFIETTDGRFVSDMYVSDVGRLKLGRSDDHASSYGGLSLAVGE
ncbi:MAG: hypothetical protein FWG87_10245 [Defluviitaleaceae bacterium]|nr:hypothetical protein [Defluviitaleaceae bacterium]